MRWLRKERVFESIPQNEVLERQRFVVYRIFSVTAVLVCVGVASKMLLTLKSNWLPYTVLCLGAVILLNYLRVTIKSNLRLAYIVMLVACLVLLHTVAYTCGGIRTGGTFFLSAVIIYAFMLLGKKGGWFFTTAAALHVLVQFYLSTYTDLTSFSLFEEKINLINEDFLVNILLTFTLIAALSSYLQSGRNVVIQRILDNNLQLEENNKLLEANNRTLEKKNEELDKFASVASHDLRAPLRAIGSLTDMVLEDEENLSFDSREKLNIVRKRAHRMDNLLSALLDYSRADRRTDHQAKVDLNALMVGLLTKHNKNEKVKILVPKNLPTLYTSPVKLEKVLDILIDNALKFNNKENPIVKVDVENEKEQFIFRVSDNGPGISPEFQQKVFVIFQTLEARDKMESTGAGLAIAKKIVEEHQGTLSISSSGENDGSTFEFTWKASDYQVNQLVDEVSRRA